MRVLIQTLLFGMALPIAIAAGDEGSVADTASVRPKADISADTASPSSDSTTMLQSAPADTAAAAAAELTARRDSVLQPAPAKPDASGVPTSAGRTSTRKIKLIKREYNYRQQVVLAVGMMAFIAIMMTTTQSWNPK